MSEITLGEAENEGLSRTERFHYHGLIGADRDPDFEGVPPQGATFPAARPLLPA